MMGGIKQHLLGELTWPEAKRRFEESGYCASSGGAPSNSMVPICPLIAMPLMPIIWPRRWPNTVIRRGPWCSQLVSYGVSYHHEDFSGTLSVNPETLSQMVYDIGMSAVRHGITKLVIVNGHGGNSPALHFAAQMINRDAHIFTSRGLLGESSDPDIYAMAYTPNDCTCG